MKDEDKDVKVEPRAFTKPVKKLTAFELEQIASRQRAHDVKVQMSLVTR